MRMRFVYVCPSVLLVPSAFGPGSLIDARLAVFGTMILVGSLAYAATEAGMHCRYHVLIAAVLRRCGGS